MTWIGKIVKGKREGNGEEGKSIVDSIEGKRGRKTGPRKGKGKEN